MSDTSGGIKLEGLDKLLKNLDGSDKAMEKAALEGLERAGMEIVAESQQNLRKNGSWVTGLLSQSGHSQRKGDEVTAGFFDTTNRAEGYALYVEFGRRAGKMPPPEDMAAYAYKKFHLRDWKQARAMGWGIAKNIAKRGTLPHPFFVPAVQKMTRGAGLGGVMGTVADSIRKMLRSATANFAVAGRNIKNTPIK